MGSLVPKCGLRHPSTSLSVWSHGMGFLEGQPVDPLLIFGARSSMKPFQSHNSNPLAGLSGISSSHSESTGHTQLPAGQSHSSS